jgi:flagellar hook-associated protein 2
MAIPIGGLATGVDTDTLIQRLLAIERRPVTGLETRKLKFQALATAFQDLNSRLTSLKTRADTLKDPAIFFGRSVTSSDETVATATAASGVVKGTFTLTPSALAKGSIAAAGVTKANLTDVVASTSADFQFKLGATGTVVSVAVTASTTLDNLVVAINNADAGVKAAAVNTGTAAAPAYKLTLTSNATGAANNIVIVTDPTTLPVANTQTAADAVVVVTGLGTFTRPTNTFADVIDGVTITLKKATGSTDLAVDYDKAATQSKLQNMLDAYNDVIGAIDAQTKGTTSADGKVSTGAFSADVVPRVLRSSLASMIASTVTGTFTRLAEVGVTTQKNGTLTLDPAKFQKALTDNPEAVSALLAGTGTKDGIADLLSAKADAASKSLTGTIAVRQDGITASIKTLQKQIDAGLTRLETTERTLRARFVALEQLVSRTQSTGSSLLTQLQNLPRSTTRSSR